MVHKPLPHTHILPADPRQAHHDALSYRQPHISQAQVGEPPRF